MIIDKKVRIFEPFSRVREFPIAPRGTESVPSPGTYWRSSFDTIKLVIESIKRTNVWEAEGRKGGSNVRSCVLSVPLDQISIRILADPPSHKFFPAQPHGLLYIK